MSPGCFLHPGAEVASAMSTIGAPPRAPLPITIVNGNLKFVRQPLLLGHYRSMALTGTERVMDRLIGGTMQKALDVGRYPDEPGAEQIFVNAAVNETNPLQLPRPEAVIVVGLGDEGALRAADLAYTVRQGVLAWAQRSVEEAEQSAADGEFELAATLIGSGGTGISAGQSARLVAQGVLEANERLAGSGWRCVGRLYLIELYLDRATEAWRALRTQAAATSRRCAVGDTVHTGVGALLRPLDASYRGAEYDLITAVTVRGDRGDDAVSYIVDTRRARTEVRAQAMQGQLLRDLVATASNEENSDPQLGRTLFRLLVPLEMEPFLGGTTDAVIEVDGGTAGIPWEMLDTAAGTRGAGDPPPWAIRAKLLRKLRTDEFRAHVVEPSAESHLLVIGEPACDPERYPRLPGAREEARVVAARLAPPGEGGAVAVKALISPDDETEAGPDARTVINALLERDWRVVHIAGHGEPPEWSGRATRGLEGRKSRDGDPRGVVLSNGIFLGPREFRSMRVVPELVFLSCCHLAARTTDQLLREGPGRAGRYDRARFAAGAAEELIKIGVRCVIAAGWAVEDGPASTFASTFYDRLVQGERFIDAVASARGAAYEQGGNTWAAYQCYGDPDWRLRREAPGAPRAARPPADEFAAVASAAALTLALETLAVSARFDTGPGAELCDRIRYLEGRFEQEWGSVGAVAEAFGAAWVEARDDEAAAAWYRQALAANDGSASMRAAEQLGNLRARRAWESVEAAKAAFDRRAAGARGGDGAWRAGKARGGTPREAPPDGAKDALRRAVRAAREDIAGALTLLERLAGIESTIERESLCGSAWKRMALLEAVAGRRRAEMEAIAAMRSRYAAAEAMARASGHPELFRPALNRMAADLIVEAGNPAWHGFGRAAVDGVRRTLAAKTRDDPDFWSVAGLTELRLYEAAARGRLAAEREDIEREYLDLHARVAAAWLWASVRDQMRFVLPKYASRAPAGERQAAASLLKLLTRLARGMAPS